MGLYHPPCPLAILCTNMEKFTGVLTRRYTKSCDAGRSRQALGKTDEASARAIAAKFCNRMFRSYSLYRIALEGDELFLIETDNLGDNFINAKRIALNFDCIFCFPQRRNFARAVLIIPFGNGLL